MSSNQHLNLRRCFNHAGREAAARCPACKRDFCRECITEHAGKMLCVNCLRDSSAKKKHDRRWIVSVLSICAFLTALIIAFLCFVWLGRTIAHSEVAEHASHNVAGQ